MGIPTLTEDQENKIEVPKLKLPVSSRIRNGRLSRRKAKLPSKYSIINWMTCISEIIQYNRRIDLVLQMNITVVWASNLFWSY